METTWWTIGELIGRIDGRAIGRKNGVKGYRWMNTRCGDGSPGLCDGSIGKW